MWRRGHRGRRSWARRIWSAAWKIVASVVALSILAVLLFRWVPLPTTAVVLQRAAGRMWAAEPLPRPQYRWAPWSTISPHVPLAVVAAEDQRFPQHFGFDLDSIADALEDGRRGRRLRGASTISQQVAKNVFLWQGRSVFRKACEAYVTVLLELLWPKQRILEVYLNVAEFGPNLFGVGAASEAYFDKPPARLSPDEAALLAAALPNPFRLRVERPSPYVRGRQAWIREQMRQLGEGYVTFNDD